MVCKNWQTYLTLTDYYWGYMHKIETLPFCFQWKQDDKYTCFLYSRLRKNSKLIYEGFFHSDICLWNWKSNDGGTFCGKTTHRMSWRSFPAVACVRYPKLLYYLPKIIKCWKESLYKYTGYICLINMYNFLNICKAFCCDESRLSFAD